MYINVKNFKNLLQLQIILDLIYLSIIYYESMILIQHLYVKENLYK